MLQKLIPIIQHHHVTKLCAIILGYGLWFCIAQYQSVTQTYQAPILFYDAQHPIKAPENVSIVLQGSRQEIYRFNNQNAVIHIDGSKYSEGIQEVMLSKENLFLPDSLKLVDLVPSHITIQVN